MILFQGSVFQNDEMDGIMERLWASCVEAIEKRRGISQTVIDACGRISEKIQSGGYDEIITALTNQGVVTRRQLEEAVSFFNKDMLTLKYNLELGVLKNNLRHPCVENVHRRIEPLGILFHIAAGNAEGLPFYSVIEGMLAGNVNILKLPSMDDGLSVWLLHELVREEPELAPYVCVLDVPSTNIKLMKQLADMSDGIVVWGGDEAVSAVRRMASPAAQIISWGHKLSFAYATAEIFRAREYRKELYALAEHICETRQLLCSSCQGIFVDSDKREGILTAAQCFCEILEEVAGKFPREPVGIRGKISISLYNEDLEETATGHTVFRGKGVSVTAAMDSRLSLSYMFKNCWVKPLPRENIVKALKGMGGYLQTAGLLCQDSERAALTEQLVKAGVTRIVNGSSMSRMASGAAHDGEYPLRRYCKIVEVEA